MASWVSRIKSGFGYIFDNDSPGTDHHVITNRNRHDRSIGADRYAGADLCASPLTTITLSRAAFHEGVVDEHSAVRNKTVFPDVH